MQKLLLVDDSKLIHTLVKGWLAGERIDVYSAFDGEEAVTTAGSLLPDLILLDVNLPGTDGFETCRRLKTDPTTCNIPIVFLTGSNSTEEKIRGLELGAVDYVTKPFEPAEFKARVRATLRTKYLMDLLAERALIDGLTGLWNRACFEKRLVCELSLARRTGRPISCMMLDADHFKKINDTYGHPVGDEVLRGIAGLLSAICRREDVICRHGGEEFSIILPNTRLAGAAALAERLRQALEEREAVHHGPPVPVSCSFGVAEALPGDAADALVGATDAALYRAKQTGRNRVVTADERPANSGVSAI